MQKEIQSSTPIPRGTKSRWCSGRLWSWITSCPATKRIREMMSSSWWSSSGLCGEFSVRRNHPGNFILTDKYASFRSFDVATCPSQYKMLYETDPPLVEYSVPSTGGLRPWREKSKVVWPETPGG